MPLSEFLRLAIEKLEASKKKTCPDEPSSRAENDLVEMVGENGQLMMQGQSSSDTKNLPCNTRTVRDTRVGVVESIFNDISPVMPSGDMDLSQDDEMVHLLNYPIDDSQLDYFSELLPKVYGVTANGMSTDKSFVSEDTRNSYDQSQTAPNEREASKVSSSKACTLSSWLPQQGQISDPSSGSEVSDMISNCARKLPDVFGSLVKGRDMLNDFKNGKMENRNMGMVSSNSSLFSVSHSRETTLLSSKSNLPNLDGKKKGSSLRGRHPVESKPIKGLRNKQKNIEYDFPSVVCSAIDSRLLVAKQDDALQNNTANSTDIVTDNEKDVEPLVASSVVSDNSADGISCEQAHNSKRKLYDMEESECPSDDIEAETEYVDVQKATPQGCSGVKRTRVAEVHNLSERRRRDRINEKMRTLQELIPNSNKVDKASMLDEAIGYLKMLQLQVQLMSTGGGLHMPSMMFHAGFQHIHPTHVPHFSPRDLRTVIGMGYRMGMSDVNGGSPPHPALFPLPPVQAALFRSPVSGPSDFPLTAGSNLLACGHPSRGLPNIVPRVPFMSLTGWPPISAAMCSCTSRIGSYIEGPRTTPNLYCEDPIHYRNSQLMPNAETRCISLYQKLHDKVQENNQRRCASCREALNSSVATDSKKEAGHTK